MFARFDENPAMTLQVIKETKRYGRRDGRTDGRTHGRTDGQRENSIPPTNKVCGGYNKINSTQTGQTTKKSNKPKVLSLKPKKSSPSNAEILEPVPSTSGLNSKGGPIDFCSNEDSHHSSDYSSDNEDQTLCCVCDATQPEAFKKSDFLKLLT